jgi:ParB/RepB/Spo0J family partition protein
MAGRRVSFADLADDDVEDEPGVDPAPPARWIAVSQCLANPRNPRDKDKPDDLSDLKSIKERQLQSCLAITPRAYLRLWPEDREELKAGPDDVVIINGNRRRAAAEKYGRAELLVVVDDGVATSRAAVLRAAYDENTARADFDPIEEARAVVEIVAQYATAKEAAEDEGWSQPWISQRKNLLKLHPELQQEVRAKAAGRDGISINVARRLGSVKGISDMSLAEQRQALAELLRADAEASETRKQVRRKVSKEIAAPISDPESSESAVEGEGALSTRSEFSAENSSGPEFPEQRAAGTEPESASSDAEGGGRTEHGEESDERQGEAADPRPWLIPADAVRRLSALLAEYAAFKGTTPEAELANAERLLRDHYADVPDTAPALG